MTRTRGVTFLLQAPPLQWDHYQTGSQQVLNLNTGRETDPSMSFAPVHAANLQPIWLLLSCQTHSVHCRAEAGKCSGRVSSSPDCPGSNSGCSPTQEFPCARIYELTMILRSHKAQEFDVLVLGKLAELFHYFLLLLLPQDVLHLSYHVTIT